MIFVPEGHSLFMMRQAERERGEARSKTATLLATREVCVRREEVACQQP